MVMVKREKEKKRKKEKKIINKLRIKYTKNLKYSMTIGGTRRPYDNNTYSMNILQTELSSLYSKNIQFDSYNGSIYISGFIQSTHMNGISGGTIDIIASTQNSTSIYNI